MDEIVKQAMTKWPDVPHCYGWLALDARGNWRMRDEQAQRANAPGEKIANAPLLAFIKRNYTSDERGCWYFQNGPQRVFVDLEAAPYIAFTDPLHGFILHTGELLSENGGAPQLWLSDGGRLFVQGGGKLAMLDDRDAVNCLDGLAIDGAPADETTLEIWLAGGPGKLTLSHHGWQAPIAHIADAEVATRFGFVARPRAA